jgi:hypothetical protein
VCWTALTPEGEQLSLLQWVSCHRISLAKNHFSDTLQKRP